MTDAPGSTARCPAMAEHGSALVGAVVWVVALLVLRPSPLEVIWAKFLLLLAPLVLLPLGLRLARSAADDGLDRPWRAVTLAQPPAALLLGGAFLLPQGFTAAVLALPWLATTGLIALLGLARVRRHASGSMHALYIDAGMVYVAVGGGWAVLDRLGLRPLDFEPVIVLLTAIHFHYAGFVLPLVAGLIIRRAGGRAARVAGVGVIAGVPLVAVGITTTQLGLPPLLESVAVWLTAAAGMLAGWLQVKLALGPGRPPLIRCLWMVAGVSLIASMALAALYGSRFQAPLAWLDIPWMRAVHGSANALGFGALGLLGWTLAENRPGPGVTEGAV